jgi:aryl-alcohol dehydrogenase-like predicted oxidoreductase
MRYISVPGINEPVSVIGLGVIGELSAGSSPSLGCKDLSTRRQLLSFGLDSGINLFDVGEDYEGGFAEELLGSFIGAFRRDQVVISTKFKPSNNGYRDVLTSCENSLKRLNTDYIDIYQLQWRNPAIPLDETVNALLTLRRDGKVRCIGLSNLSKFDLLDVIAKFPNLISTFQLEHNLAVRPESCPLLEICNANCITPLTYRTVGFLRGGYKRTDRLIALSKVYDCSVPDLCLTWALQSSNGVALVQTMKFEHLKSSLASANRMLQAMDLRLLEDEFSSSTVELFVNQIDVENVDADNTHLIYTSLAQAIENKMGVFPSPSDIAREIEERGLLRPIEVIRISGGRYKLVQGRMRFWAWQIAYGDASKIPSIVLNSES